jgi:hypothetical protein
MMGILVTVNEEVVVTMGHPKLLPRQLVKHQPHRLQQRLKQTAQARQP